MCILADAGDVVRCTYVARQDRVVFASHDAIGARKDLNGILLLDSALQAPISKPDNIVRIELPLPEVRLLNRLYFKTGYRFLETGLKPVNRYDVIA